MLIRLKNLVFSLRFLPHLLVYYSSKIEKRKILDYERDRWLEINRFSRRGFRGFLFLLNIFPEYRTLFYLRMHASWLSFFAHPQLNLYIHTPEGKIGKGLIFWHGFSTVLNAQSIGENCEVWHGVTIGKKSTYDILDKPVIGNNVKLCAGSIVIGNIEIGDDSTIAAGSVVIHSVPSNALAVGTPACIK